MRSSTDVLGRVHDPRVDVAELLEREQVRGVLGVVEDVGRGLVDRQRAGAGGGVRRSGRRGSDGSRRTNRRSWSSLLVQGRPKGRCNGVGSGVGLGMSKRGSRSLADGIEEVIWLGSVSTRSEICPAWEVHWAIG